MVLARSHTRVIDAILDDGGQPISSSGHDWAAVAIRTKGAAIAAVGVYLTTGWPGSVNQGKLQQIAAYLLGVGLPFIVLGDFNCTPNEFAQLG